MISDKRFFFVKVGIEYFYFRHKSEMYEFIDALAKSYKDKVYFDKELKNCATFIDRTQKKTWECGTIEIDNDSFFDSEELAIKTVATKKWSCPL